ncbi:hypothetical protein K0M31_007317 [Melipona bicolor]|uniref:Uncharacterized protein n=1 Tax=Melipona bicolor TaxID=60889 RepID=A0AA40KVK2_9HYME|nr:hypothetical protein K0M31_007317 [Melipona bicolor]
MSHGDGIQSTPKIIHLKESRVPADPTSPINPERTGGKELNTTGKGQRRSRGNRRARFSFRVEKLREKFWKAALKRRIKTCRAIIHWKVAEDAYETAISINDVEPLEELRHELSLPGGRASAYHVSELSHVPDHTAAASGTQDALPTGYIVPESNAIILGGRRHLV